MIYATLIQNIETVLGSVDAIKAIYPYPVQKVAKYPAAVFFPDMLENTFETTLDNKKTYRFKVWITVGAAQKEKVDIFSSILPKAVDDVLAAFDTAWSQGTIDGHPIWVVVSSGQWGMAESPEGLEAYAELTVEFRTLTSI